MNISKYYNEKTLQFKETRNRDHNYYTVQSAKKNLYSHLWLNKNTEFKVTKKKDKYIVSTSSVIYTPFASSKFTIKNLPVEFQNIEIKEDGIYENIRIVTDKDEYNELFAKKNKLFLEQMTNSRKIGFDKKANTFKKIEIGSKRSKLDEKMETTFAILRSEENKFEILRRHSNKQYAVIITFNNENHSIGYYDHYDHSYFKMTDKMVSKTIEKAINFLDNWDKQ